jgi:SAM-dependent methyltransferase
MRSSLVASEPTESPSTYLSVPTLDPALWDHEYRDHRVIPSSTRSIPAKALLLLDRLIPYAPGWLALDAGAGPGRNSLYLAEKGCHVVAADFSDAALESLSAKIRGQRCLHPVEPIKCSLARPFPFLDRTFDFHLDAYLFCHFLSKSEQMAYRDECRRVLRTGGLSLFILFGKDDEYYRSLADIGHGVGSIVSDPHNGVSKYLFDEEEIKVLLSPSFTMRFFINFQFEDWVMGRIYVRSLYVLLLEKPND